MRADGIVPISNLWGAAIKQNKSGERHKPTFYGNFLFVGPSQTQLTVWSALTKPVA